VLSHGWQIITITLPLLRWQSCLLSIAVMNGEGDIMSNQTMTFTSDELFTIQEMMREAKENPFHPGDYQDEETEKLIERITDALDKSYDLF